MKLYLFLDTPLTMKRLVTACKEVSDWHTLGIQLGLTAGQLNNIHVTYHAHGVDRLKTVMFNVWLKRSPNASWTDLITALRAMGEERVASDIEAEHIPGNTVRQSGLFCQNSTVTLRCEHTMYHTVLTLLDTCSHIAYCRVYCIQYLV